MLTLKDTAVDYKATARILWERMELVTLELSCETDPDIRMMLTDRLRLLRAIYRECRDIGTLCERYYERGYFRNERYTV